MMKNDILKKQYIQTVIGIAIVILAVFVLLNRSNQNISDPVGAVEIIFLPYVTPPANMDSDSSWVRWGERSWFPLQNLTIGMSTSVLPDKAAPLLNQGIFVSFVCRRGWLGKQWELTQISDSAPPEGLPHNTSWNFWRNGLLTGNAQMTFDIDAGHTKGMIIRYYDKSYAEAKQQLIINYGNARIEDDEAMVTVWRLEQSKIALQLSSTDDGDIQLIIMPFTTH